MFNIIYFICDITPVITPVCDLYSLMTEYLNMILCFFWAPTSLYNRINKFRGMKLRFCIILYQFGGQTGFDFQANICNAGYTKLT